MPIGVENLFYTYMPGTPFETKAVEDASFTINDGEYVGIIGRTGCGKTTLVKILCLLLKQDSGKVILNGEDTGAKSYDKKKLRRTVGVVFQYPEYQLFEDTVKKDIAYGPLKMGVSEEKAFQRVEEVMDLLDLPLEIAERSPFELSGGQKRRVAIAGVLAMHPDFLILDEPVAGLDPAGRRALFTLINKLNEKGKTIILITHSMDDLAAYASRVLVLNGGKIIMDAAPKDVFARTDELLSVGLDVPEVSKIVSALNAHGFAVDKTIITTDELSAAILKRLKR